MTHRKTDSRYSCINEKQSTPAGWVVRFNGAWIGQSFSKAVAQAIIVAHQQTRAKEAQGNV